MRQHIRRYLKEEYTLEEAKQKYSKDYECPVIEALHGEKHWCIIRDTPSNRKLIRDMYKKYR
jgi:hypothetical protein